MGSSKAFRSIHEQVILREERNWRKKDFYLNTKTNYKYFIGIDIFVLCTFYFLMNKFCIESMDKLLDEKISLT